MQTSKMRRPARHAKEVRRGKGCGKCRKVANPAKHVEIRHRAGRLRA